MKSPDATQVLVRFYDFLMVSHQSSFRSRSLCVVLLRNSRKKNTDENVVGRDLCWGFDLVYIVHVSYFLELFAIGNTIFIEKREIKLRGGLDLGVFYCRLV